MESNDHNAVIETLDSDLDLEIEMEMDTLTDSE